MSESSNVTNKESSVNGNENDGQSQTRGIRDLVDIETVKTHALVEQNVAKNRPIFVIKGSQSPKDMQRLLDYAATAKCPRDRADAEAQGKFGYLQGITLVLLLIGAVGYIVADVADDPVFLWRDTNGSGKEEDDKIVLWTVPA
jgi:hypothetical protein